MKKRLDWVEQVLAGFTSDRELVQVVLGDLSEEWQEIAAQRGRFAATAWYISQLLRTAPHLAGLWCLSTSRVELLAKIAMALVISCLALIVTTAAYTTSLFIANFALGMLSAGSEGGDPLTINWNGIAMTTLVTGVVCSFTGALIVSACARTVPMVSVMLISFVLVIATLLVPLVSQAVWPLWSFVVMPPAIALATNLGGITGLLARRSAAPGVGADR